MHVVILCGPPCAGKTTLARSLAQPDDVVLDYDDIARACGSPAQWRHPEPWRTMAEQEMQAYMAHVRRSTAPGTAYVLRLAPRPSTRASLAAMLDATVYLVDPGRPRCRAWAVGRPRARCRPSVGGTGSTGPGRVTMIHPHWCDVDKSGIARIRHGRYPAYLSIRTRGMGGSKVEDHRW